MNTDSGEIPSPARQPRRRVWRLLLPVIVLLAALGAFTISLTVAVALLLLATLRIFDKCMRGEGARSGR